jgi:hypothetical protein
MLRVDFSSFFRKSIAGRHGQKLSNLKMISGIFLGDGRGAGSGEHLVFVSAVQRHEKPLKRLTIVGPAHNTPLKQGVNENCG